MKGIRFFHPIEKKWKNWRNIIGKPIVFKTSKKALEEFEKNYSVKQKIIKKYKVINLK